MNLINIYNHKRQIYLFCRDEKGNLIVNEDDSFFPYFYEKDYDGKFKTIDGQLAKKVFVSEPSDVPKTRSNNSYEADILFVKRYMIDRIKIIDKCPIKYAFIDIEVLSDELPNPQEAIYPISCISVYNSMYKNKQTWYLEDYNYLKNLALQEKKMLDDFILYMQKEKFDLWLSWHVGFDYNYLYNRVESIKSYGKKNFGELISPIGKSRYGDGEVFYPAGISIVDYLGWDKKVTLNRRKSYSLDNVAIEELKDKPNEKIDFSKLNPEIKRKNINDIERMVKLEEKLKYIDYFDEIRRLTKVEWEDMVWNSRIIDMLLLQEAKDKKIVLPMKPREDRGTLTEKEEYQGAYRDVFKTGRISPVGVYDVGSAYPSMITNFCLDPANIYKVVGKDSPCIKIEDTYFNQNPNTLLPIVVKKIMTIKNNIKSELSKCPLNSEQYKKVKIKYDAIKSVVNSAYGVFGLRFFRLFKKEVASATTFLVRDLLHYVQDKLEKQGYEIIYIDTDSIMINNNNEDISNILNEYVKQWAKEKYDKTVDVEFEYKGYFDPIILLTKCRYKGWLVTDKGTEVKTKGIESKRKDSTEFIRRFQTELLDKIKNKEAKENIFNWIKEEIKQLPNQALKDIAFPCKLARKPKDYKNLTIFVRALNNTPDFKKKVGSNFYYIFVKPENNLKIQTTIYVKDYLPSKDPESPNRLEDYIETLDKNLSRKEGIEYIRNKLQKPELETSIIKVLHQKERPKDVMAFDEDNNEHIKRDMVDWDMIIKRNILYKLDTIFEAMEWDVKEIGYQTTPKLPEIKPKPAQIKPKKVKPIERLQEAEKAFKNKEKFAGEVSKKTRQTSSLESRVQVPNPAPNILNSEYNKIQEIKAQTKEIEDFKLEDLIIKQLDFKVTKEYITKNHYSHTISSAIKVSVGFYYKKELITAVVYGVPVGRAVSQMLNVSLGNLLELVRVFSKDGLPKNTESYCIAQSFKLLKEKYPQYKYLISYADAQHGHVGYIYQATNWRYIGEQSRTNFGIFLDGKEIHPRTCNAKFGTSSKKLLKEKFGDRIEFRNYLKKHVYLMCLGNKKEKREWYKQFPEQPYPKIKGKNKDE